MTITLNNEYEKAIVVLALRELASRELQKAVTHLEARRLSEGQSCSDRGDIASKIANNIG